MKITSKWKTYRTVGYTFQIARSDPRSAGGVHHHQAKRTPRGVVLVRIMQSNGRFSDTTPGAPADGQTVNEIHAAPE